MAKAISKVDLVSDSTMVDGAKLLYRAVRKHAPYKKIKDSVYITRVETRGASKFISVGINTSEGIGAPFARAFDVGSGIHGKKKAKYPIRPRGRTPLAFQGTNEFSGQLIRTNLVMHPGVEGVNYTQKAKDEVRGQIRDKIKKDASDKIRLYLKTEFTKIGTVK